MKVCRACGEDKPLDDFYNRAAKCKECTKKAVRENYRRNHGHYQAYERLRFKDPGRKQKLAEYQKKRRAANPLKSVAWNAVNNALRDGRLTREPCKLCGATKAQAHHNDYSKPLDVEWLCFKCHRTYRHGQVVV